MGWADVYEANLDDQWVDVTGLPPGQYWLENVIDPNDQLLESDETNNTARILIDLATTPGTGDRFEFNDTIGAATNLGFVGDRTEAAPDAARARRRRLFPTAGGGGRYARHRCRVSARPGGRRCRPIRRGPERDRAVRRKRRPGACHDVGGAEFRLLPAGFGT